jgi:hypothetical protein
MSEPKPLASLSHSLLARKGTARPAMRPQLQSVHNYRDALSRAYDGGAHDSGVHDLSGPQGDARDETGHDATIDDLGWNDMGEGGAHDTPDTALEPAADVASATRPVALTPAPKGKPKAAGPRRSALQDGRRAAFTLRLDAERHLKLRLACTLDGRSAQQLLIAALDALLADYSGLDDLAEQVRKAR